MIRAYSIKNKLKTSKKLIGVFAAIFIVFFTYGCSTGINKDIKKQKSSSKATSGNYTIKDVTIDIISINDLSENQKAIFQKKVEKIGNSNLKKNLTNLINVFSKKK